MICKNCGADIQDDESFCYKCGVPIPKPNNTKELIAKKRHIWPFVVVSFFVLIVLVTVIVVISVSGSTEKRYAEQLALADRYLDELDYDRAIAAYKEAIKIDPMQADAYIGLGEAYEERGELEATINVLKKGYDHTGDEEIKEYLDKLIKKRDEQNTVETEVDEELDELEAERSLYDAFLNNEVSVKYVKKERVSLDSYDVEEGNYCLNDLLTLWESMWEGWGGTEEFDNSGSVSSRIIDCGLDGNNVELVVEVHYERTGGYCLSVIKQIDDELEICYLWEGADPKYTTSVSYSGFIEEFYAMGAASTYYNYAYINPDGEYKEWYNKGVDGDWAIEDSISIHLFDQQTYIESYNFGNDAKTYICPKTKDGDASDEQIAVLREAGFNAYDSEAIERIIEEHRIQMNLSKEVIEYDKK